MKNVIWPACGDPPFEEEERQLNLQKLRQENDRLREEASLDFFQLTSLSNITSYFLMIHEGSCLESFKDLVLIDLLTSDAGSSQGELPTFVQNQRMGNPGIDLGRNPGSDISHLAYRLEGIPDMENALMAETAAGAMDELTDFCEAAHFISCNARVESSKDSATVTMPGMDLVDMFLDPNKWVDLFPTIVTEARTIQVLEAGTVGNRHGSLQMMYEQMHILSPLVPPREFYFLRLCQQLEPGRWVIADIIWVEHVEANDRIQTHRLYRDLICGSYAYGAERWIASLQRICERLAFSTAVPPRELGGVVTSPEGRKSIVNLAHRMVKIFCSSLSMSGKLDFRKLSEGNNSGVRVAICKNAEQGQPIGTVVSAATSFWLPLSPQNVFNFFKAEKSRAQWDILSNGNPVREISRISNGADPGNCISIIRPFIPAENNMLILQESCTDSSVSMVVYAPVGIPAMNVAISGEDSSIIPILPSGFVISGDDGHKREQL
ncbi:homeobox-leucine zipper protein HDG11-like [Populus alba x Populus x berolinensis]|nr:homeobox-leucine zipper protein HDG11-like [Populus alba x Populus x berolinensis]